MCRERGTGQPWGGGDRVLAFPLPVGSPSYPALLIITLVYLKQIQ